MEKHIFLLIILILLQFSISLAFSNETDQQALLSFQNLVTSPNHFLANNWTKNTSFCSWFGVTCSSKRQRVVALVLPNLQLQGTISPSLANLSFLSVLNLENNLLHGGIPYGLGHLSRFRVIDVQNNQLNGSIPTSLFQHQRVQVISLASNELVGEMWRGPWYVPELRVLNLRNNRLTGIIPPSVGNATKLMNFILSRNIVSGNIPKENGNLSQLGLLSLANNELTGFIPATLFNISSLLFLYLGLNRLSGPLWLDEGKIVSNLNYLSISNNQISSRIPSSICQLTELKVLSISFNNITGDIPRNIDCLSKLEMFLIGGNPITGTIPTSLGNISTLQHLDCENNYIVGQIPPELGKLSNLRELTLYGNELSGLIPECLGNLSMLQALSLGSNKFSSKLPLSLWKMRGLLFLHLSSNHFSGVIPSILGELQNLLSLDLSNNTFFGQIPLSFANLIILEFLDLSSNALSGTIPKSLENLSFLKSINVLFNGLEGEIPSGGVFANSTLQSFLGNKGLRGMHILEIPACAITNPGKQSKVKKVVLKIVTPVIISSCLIFLLVSIWIMKRNKKGKSKDVEKVPEIRTHQLISYHEIQQVTNNFDESNLIGVGGSSSVYKGTLSGGSTMAIKVLDLENEQVCKRFDAECKVMRNVRHRNLVPVITTCSSDYIRAFVLKYMSNGSLENWLYREESHLNLLQRVDIMLDVAVAIEYLHHGHNTPIVHCDLKPANILLDEDMVAHIGDFGISKILAISKSLAHTETLGTLGYIAPEYGSEGIVSASGDVYSYGIMLMEVLTKRRPTDEEMFNENLDLRKWISLSFSGTMMDVVDANLFFEEEQVTCKSEICIASMIELALDCTKEMPKSRITMKEVVKRLNKIKDTFLTR